MIKSWYRKKVHKQARKIKGVTEAHAKVLIQLYGFHNLLVHNKLDPEEFYEAVGYHISTKERQKDNFKRHYKLLKIAFIKGCRKNDCYKTLEEILDYADYEARLAVSIRGPEL